MSEPARGFTGSDLSFEGVTVAFSGVVALDDLTLSVPCDRIIGIIGPNGAGKTTLLNVASGFASPRSGRVLFGDQDLTRRAPATRARMGMARTFQTPRMFPGMTVRDNVHVASRQAHGRGLHARQRTDHALARTGLDAVAGLPVEQLNSGQQRFCEIARALALRPSVLLLDEPGAGLRDEEVTQLSNLLRELAAEGLGTLIVDHDMRLILPTCELLAVIEFGRLIADGPTDSVRRDPAVLRAYLGDEVAI